jgi:hypothetical protein
MFFGREMPAQGLCCEFWHGTGQHGAVRQGQMRPADLATQQRDLVAQHHQLRDHRGLARAASSNQPNPNLQSGTAAEQPFRRS